MRYLKNVVFLNVVFLNIFMLWFGVKIGHT